MRYGLCFTPLRNPQKAATDSKCRRLAGPLSWHTLASTVLARPWRMLAAELIVPSTCAYLALVYAVFYMTFQAFPLVFQGLYGLSPGECGLVFLTIGGGCLVALPLFWWWDALLLQAVKAGRPWTRKEEYRRLPLACLGGPLFGISLFWLGWSAREGGSFVLSMLAGLPFGMGFMREHPFSMPFLDSPHSRDKSRLYWLTSRQ